MQDNYKYNYIDYINFDNLQISRIKYSMNMETEIHMHVSLILYLRIHKYEEKLLNFKECRSRERIMDRQYLLLLHFYWWKLQSSSGPKSSNGMISGSPFFKGGDSVCHRSDLFYFPKILHLIITPWYLFS